MKHINEWGGNDMVVREGAQVSRGGRRLCSSPACALSQLGTSDAASFFPLVLAYKRQMHAAIRCRGLLTHAL